MNRKLTLIIILILVVLNLGVGYFLYYSAKVKADELTSSAKSAVDNVTTQNATKFGLNTADLPKTDVAGVDPAGITRYQKAMRTSYSKTAANVEITEYKVLAPLNVVLSYYKTQLAKNDWIINESSASMVTFSKASQQISITGTTTGGVTTYSVILK